MNLKAQTFGIGIFLLVIAIPSPSFADELDEEVKAGQAKHGCFYARQANDFDVLDKQNFIVYAPTKSKAYRVRIARPSNELRFAEGIAFEGRDGRVCGHAGETVALRRGRGGQRYSITDVWRLDEAQVEQLIDQYKSPADGQKLEPQDTEGADIERDLSGAEENK
jgi:hypothetical protein